MSRHPLEPAAETIPTIEVEELRDRLDRHEPTLVLDIRPTAEREEWSIPGSAHLDAYVALKAGDPNVLDGIDPPDGMPVVAVCGAGNTSRIAAARLRARGIPAWSLVGGMKGWSVAWNTAEQTEGGATLVQVRRTGKG